ncbi:MAG: magnesium-translocating P-type ATPase [Oscillospiraceae bacterium]|nr:magnesium-translocating P-type ATPase [Oscillospiraceae bacterium]
MKMTPEQTQRRKDVRERLQFSATSEIDTLFTKLGTTPEGIDESDVQDHRNQYGDNTITHGKKVPIFKHLFYSFASPFTLILLCLAIVSVFTDIITAAPGQANYATVIIIVAMVLLSGILRFVQETRSGNAADSLLNMIKTTTNVQRQKKGREEIPLEDVVVGDIVHLTAGDIIPADIRIIHTKDLFISQSALTGESVAVEKIADVQKDIDALTETPNLIFMGTNVVSGSASGVVVVTGDDTIFGEMAKTIGGKHDQTSFEKGVNSVSWLLIRFMFVMVPIVLFVNGFTKGDWIQAVLFALSVAVGLTPEMLPMIVTTCLAKGAVAMSKEKTIIKNLNSIQNLGSMDILCTDKTGTLTQDKVVLQYHLNIHGADDLRVLRHAFLNSYYQTGLKNLMDISIIDRTQEEQDAFEDLRGLAERFVKVDEIPFDFERRRMSVVVANVHPTDDVAGHESAQEKRQMITKGAVEEMLEVCTYAESNGQVVPLTDDVRTFILKKVDELNEDGMRVIAVAQKTNPAPVGEFSVADESEMVLMGYLAFLDPPKESAATAIKALNDNGVRVKILTGDNEKVTRNICRQVGISVKRILLGFELESMSDEALYEAAKEVSVFVKLSPQQKARVITVLRDYGHDVGYMGDGINDAAAMKASDVGISVDTAVDIAKESADVILLEKDLTVLERGLIEGRKTYANMIKYIKITASSNFGNMLSVLVASAFLPFLPMLPIHLLILNLIYDFSCSAIPWDNVDKEFLAVPRKWEASSISRFMLWIGPTSSVFDITTFGLLYFFIAPAVVGGQMYHQITDVSAQMLFVAVFHAGWFVESMWTQTFVIHMLRTPKIPFIHSRASFPLVIISFAGIAVLTIIPFTAFGTMLGLAALPLTFFPWLILTICLYMVLVTVFKRIFIKRYGQLL